MRLLIIVCIFFYTLISFSYKQELGNVDLKYILKTSLPSKNLQIEMDKGRNLFQKSINQEENALRQAEKEINEKRDTISGEDFKLLVKDFEEKVASIQKLVQKSRQQLETNFQLSQKLIADTVNDLVIELAEKEKLLIVFKSDNIIYVNDEINYTSIILEELRMSFGYGFQWETPIGPLSFTWADAIKKESYDQLQKFEFRLGSYF